MKPHYNEAGELVVPWVTGRRAALALSIAIAIEDARGGRWSSLHPSAKEKRLREAGEVLTRWEQQEVLIRFEHPYRGDER